MKNVMRIEFEVDNAAFFDDDNRFNPWEVASILKGIAHRIQNGGDAGIIRDTNGNKVGSWSLDIPETED